MNSLKKKEKNLGTAEQTTCTKLPCCFFCIMKEPDSLLRRAGVAKLFKEMPFKDDQEHVLVMSSLWNIAMTQPDDPVFPSLGIFKCMANLIYKGVNNKDWLLKDQNIYIPYYAAHVIGSYTMNKIEFAEKAVKSGVVPPLLELLRGKMSWVEQRVAVRALGHLASYETTFEAVAVHEEEVVNLAMKVACTCLENVYVNFVGIKDKNKRLEYHRDLLTRGVGGVEMENRKAEEWASQLQYWSLYLLNCFACKERSLNLICKTQFLIDLCNMWCGLSVNRGSSSSPAGIGLIRIICYSKVGRNIVSECKEVIEKLCNLSRSSDDWQYMGIDCLLLLLKDKDSRYKIIETAIFFLIDLLELNSLLDRPNLGEAITRVLLLEYKLQTTKEKLRTNKKFHKAIEEVRELKVERRKREKMMSKEKVEERKVLVGLIKHKANGMFCLGDVEQAAMKYSEALQICPLKLKKERMILYSNRAQCYLLLREPDAAIRDATRALCLSTPANSHSKSLWRRSQAYDLKGMAKESLMDCMMFINGCIESKTSNKRVKIPYYAARMISKHMDATWIFANARSKILTSQVDQKLQEPDDEIMEKKSGIPACLSTIIEEPMIVKGGSKKTEVERPRRRKKAIVARSM